MTVPVMEMSNSTHAMVNDSMGSYVRQKELMPYFVHETTTVLLSPSAGGDNAIYKIGTAIAETNGTGPCTCNRNGTTDTDCNCTAPDQKRQNVLPVRTLDGPWQHLFMPNCDSIRVTIHSLAFGGRGYFASVTGTVSRVFDSTMGFPGEGPTQDYSRRMGERDSHKFWWAIASDHDRNTTRYTRDCCDLSYPVFHQFVPTEETRMGLPLRGDYTTRRLRQCSLLVALLAAK